VGMDNELFWPYIFTVGFLVTFGGLMSGKKSKDLSNFEFEPIIHELALFFCFASQA
jgi:hypothetical protein